jgi:hypothetical protein
METVKDCSRFESVFEVEKESSKPLIPNLHADALILASSVQL